MDHIMTETYKLSTYCWSCDFDIDQTMEIMHDAGFPVDRLWIAAHHDLWDIDLASYMQNADFQQLRTNEPKHLSVLPTLLLDAGEDFLEHARRHV